jgi:hypothetical protein
LDHTCTTYFVFANSFWKIFSKSFLQIVKCIWIRLQEAFFRFEIFSHYFKCFSFDLTKLPLDEILLLVFKRVLIDINWNLYLGCFWKCINWKSTYQFEIYQLKIFIRYQLKRQTSFRKIWRQTSFRNISTKIFFKVKIFIRYQSSFRKVWSLMVRSFCFGLILSPPLALIAKNGDFVNPNYFLPHWYK